MEEILLENMYRNPSRNFSIWDSILYEKVKTEPNITLLLNCACCDAMTEENTICSVTGFQLTTYTWHTVEAKIFADCSGDSVLAELCGADYMVGREAKETFGESMALEQADRKTMGMSFAEYLSLFRHRRALELLEDGELSITEIASESGYGSLRSFHLHFARLQGCTPSEYKRNP